jgi:hypothetical protein
LEVKWVADLVESSVRLLIDVKVALSVEWMVDMTDLHLVEKSVQMWEIK